jgi:DNA-directed RNA polymerase subunit RPC12/RpoP
MSDVNCPYCNKEQEINHDDGYGYEEDDHHKQWCIDCDKEFEFTTSIIYHYNVYCKDGDHKMEQSAFAEHKELFSCENCDHYEVRRN